MTAPTTPPSVNWRELLSDAVEVYADEVTALRLRAEQLERMATSFRDRAADLSQRTRRLQHLLELTDPTKQGDPHAS